MQRVLPTAARGRRGPARRLFHVLAGAVLAVSFSLAASTGAQAFTPNVTEATDHFLHCLALLFSDPVAHAGQCSPSLIASGNASLVAGSGGPAPAAEEEPPCDNACTTHTDCPSGVCSAGVCVPIG